MDLNTLLIHSQYALPVGIVLVCAVLVFVFGFKNAEQPPFAQLSDADRKQNIKKRTKIREKKSTNGSIGTEKTSPAKKTSQLKSEGLKKTIKSDDVEWKPVDKSVKKLKNSENKVGNENKVEQTKNKKNLKNLQHEKPVDFDDGDWEQAYSRKDKKNKKKEEETIVPVIKNKKLSKKTDIINELKESKDNKIKDIDEFGVNNKQTSIKDKVHHMKIEINDKSVKDTQNKELKEKNEMVVILKRLSNDVIEQKTKSDSSKVIEIEEKKNIKVKKTKKNNENEAFPSEVTESLKQTNVNNKEVKVPIAEAVVKVQKLEEKNAAVFDELSDTWTEAKPQRKSKRKTRKDN